MSTASPTSQRDASGAQLAVHVAALRERIDRELKRAPVGSVLPTELVGGWAKLGERLDGLFHAIFEVLCAEHGLEAERMSRSVVGASLATLTAGQVVYAVKHAWANMPARHPLVAAVLTDVRSAHSVLHEAIDTRNAIVHGRGTPDAHGALQRLDAFVADVERLAPR